jgi:hypothetical protein
MYRDCPVSNLSGKKGSQTLLERAGHQPWPLPEDVKVKLRKIVERAEKK